MSKPLNLKGGNGIVNFLFPADLTLAAKLQAIAEDTSFSDVVRRAVRQYLASNRAA